MFFHGNVFYLLEAESLLRSFRLSRRAMLVSVGVDDSSRGHLQRDVTGCTAAKESGLADWRAPLFHLRVIPEFVVCQIISEFVVRHSISEYVMRKFMSDFSARACISEYAMHYFTSEFAVRQSISEFGVREREQDAVPQDFVFHLRACAFRKSYHLTCDLTYLPHLVLLVRV